jgi:hypothetical protein
MCYWKNGLLVQGLRNGKEPNAKALIEYNPSMLLSSSLAHFDILYFVFEVLY